MTGAHLGAVARMVFVGEAQAAQCLLAAKGRHGRHHFLLYICRHPELARPIVTHHLQCKCILSLSTCQLVPISHKNVPHIGGLNAPHPFPGFNKC